MLCVSNVNKLDLISTEKIPRECVDLFQFDGARTHSTNIQLQRAEATMNQLLSRPLHGIVSNRRRRVWKSCSRFTASHPPVCNSPPHGDAWRWWYIRGVLVCIQSGIFTGASRRGRFVYPSYIERARAVGAPSPWPRSSTAAVEVGCANARKQIVPEPWKHEKISW